MVVDPHSIRRLSWDVLGFGAVAVDDLVYVDAYPAADHKVRVRQRRRQCGGLTGTALVAAARLGARCGYAGVLGNDPLSEEVADALRREGIDLGPCVRRVEARPAYSTIIVDRADNTRTVFSSLGGLIGPDPDLPAPATIRSAAVLLVDHHGLKGTLRVARIARRHGIPIVADFERDAGPEFQRLLWLVDHLVVSERCARQLTGAGDPAEAAERLWHPVHAAVVVTSGEAGCWYVCDRRGAVRHQPAFRVEAVDTTGCGDVFHGAYAVALAEGKTVPASVRFASAAAALKAEVSGGQAGIPGRDALERFLADRGNGAFFPAKLSDTTGST
ncbi:MAG: permease [Rhodopirellula sp.]|nr:permease [Rhodopirellula sp.]